MKLIIKSIICSSFLLAVMPVELKAANFANQLIAEINNNRDQIVTLGKNLPIKLSDLSDEDRAEQVWLGKFCVNYRLKTWKKRTLVYIPGLSNAQIPMFEMKLQGVAVAAAVGGITVERFLQALINQAGVLCAEKKINANDGVRAFFENNFGALLLQMKRQYQGLLKQLNDEDQKTLAVLQNVYFGKETQDPDLMIIFLTETAMNRFEAQKAMERAYEKIDAGQSAKVVPETVREVRNVLDKEVQRAAVIHANDKLSRIIEVVSQLSVPTSGRSTPRPTPGRSPSPTDSSLVYRVVNVVKELAH